MTDLSTKRRVTATDIARDVGVSRATVGYVLNETPGQTISEATRTRVRAAAERLGYRPHRAARTLASGLSRIILLVLPNWPADFTMSTNIEEASLALDEAGYTLVTWTPRADGRTRPLWESLQPDVVVGWVPFDSEQAAAIRRTGATLLSPRPHKTSADPLGLNSGPVAQITHLVERGHRSLAFASTTDPRLRELAQERFEAAERTSTQFGIALTRVEVREDGSAAGVLQMCLESGITGIASYNDTIAAVLVGAALRTGVAVPDQIAVIGHDDAPVARLMVPALSTVHVDGSGFGKYLAQLVLEAADDGPRPASPAIATATVVQRETT